MFFRRFITQDVYLTDITDIIFYRSEFSALRCAVFSRDVESVADPGFPRRGRQP